MLHAVEHVLCHLTEGTACCHAHAQSHAGTHHAARGAVTFLVTHAVCQVAHYLHSFYRLIFVSHQVILALLGVCLLQFLAVRVVLGYVHCRECECVEGYAVLSHHLADGRSEFLGKGVQFAAHAQQFLILLLQFLGDGRLDFLLEFICEIALHVARFKLADVAAQQGGYHLYAVVDVYLVRAAGLDGCGDALHRVAQLYG